MTTTYEIRDPASTVAVMRDGDERLLVTVDFLVGTPRAEAAEAVRLIAAAPEMLDALKALIEAQEAGSLYSLAASAIAAAEGK